MKKYVLILVFAVVLFWPFHLESSKRLCVKMGLGFSWWGKVHDTWNPTTDYFDYRASPHEGTDSALDISFEFFQELSPNLGFCLGAGYISTELNGSFGEFKHPDLDDYADLSYSPIFTVTVFPVYLTAVYSYRLNLSTRLNFMGGVGYYFGTIDCIDEDMTKRLRDSRPFWNHVGWRFKSNSNTVGYHLGAGFESDININWIFFMEVFYRAAKFEKFKSFSQSPGDIEQGAGDLEGGSTFFYAKRSQGDEAMGDIDYRISHLSLSRFVFRIGFKIIF